MLRDKIYDSLPLKKQLQYRSKLFKDSEPTFYSNKYLNID